MQKHHRILRHIPFIPLLCCFVMLAAPLAAQGSSGSALATSSPDSAFLRAMILSNEGRGDAARAVVDSVLRTIPEDSQGYAEGLFWRGAFAATDEIAEQSYSRIIRDFPLHKRAEESLIRLANMEMMRGNRLQAQRYLDRIIVEHPYGQHRSKASYWRAVLFFEVNELDRACAELGTARARLSAADVELKTEIDYAARRCPTVPVPTQPPARGRGASDSGTGRGNAAARSGGAATTKAGDTGTAAGTKAGDAGTVTTKAGDTGGNAAGSTGSAAGSGAGSRSGGAATSKAADAGKAAGTTKNVEPPRGRFSVQAAAFPERVNAAAFVDALKQRGYDARIDGTVAPYRVRIGYFPTREAATVLADELKAKRVSSQAYVVEIPPT